MSEIKLVMQYENNLNVSAIVDDFVLASIAEEEIHNIKALEPNLEWAMVKTQECCQVLIARGLPVLTTFYGTFVGVHHNELSSLPIGCVFNFS